MYCLKSVLLDIRNNCTCGTHAGRRLLDGVFLPHVLKEATRSGHASRAKKKTDGESDAVKYLNKRALLAIIGKMIQDFHLIAHLCYYFNYIFKITYTQMVFLYVMGFFFCFNYFFFSQILRTPYIWR